MYSVYVHIIETIFFQFINLYLFMMYKFIARFRDAVNFDLL